MLNGKEPCDIVILAGQSNAQGCGLGEASDPYEADERILILSNEATFTNDENGKDYLKISLPWQHTLSVASLDKCGCFAHYFAREYVRQGFLKEGRNLLIINAPVGGAGFSCRNWGTDGATNYTGLWTMDGPLYQRMIHMIDEALSLNPENKLVAFLWHQGEADAWLHPDDKENAEEKLYQRYYGYFSTLVDSVRNRYNVPRLPIIAAEFVYEWASGNLPVMSCIYKATRRVVSERVGAFLETSDLPSNNQATGNKDIIHFSHESLHKLGIRYFNAFKKIVENL